MAPKQSSETFKPLLPKSLYRMANLLSRFNQKFDFFADLGFLSLVDMALNG
jgi:hypothetical protein